MVREIVFEEHQIQVIPYLAKITCENIINLQLVKKFWFLLSSKITKKSSRKSILDYIVSEIQIEIGKFCWRKEKGKFNENFAKTDKSFKRKFSCTSRLVSQKLQQNLVKNELSKELRFDDP